MISSVLTLKNANYIPDELVSIKETTLVENSYTNATHKFLLECHDDLLTSRQDLYKSILEAQNQHAINEAYVDIINNVKNIIKKILAYIEVLVKKFVTEAAKYIKADKYIMSSSVQNQIKKFPKDKSLSITGFNYTFNDNIPVVELAALNLREIDSTIDKVINNISKISTADIADLDNASSELSNDKMDSIRGQILDTDPISDVDFERFAYAVYRDGSADSSNITLKYNDIMKILDDYKNYDKKLKNIESMKREMDNKYRSILRDIDNILKNTFKIDGSNKLNDQISDAAISTMLYNRIKELFEKIEKISSFHLIAFTKKVDACKDSIVQDRSTLYKALSFVQSDTSNTFMGAKNEGLDLSLEESSTYDYTMELEYRNYLLEYQEMNIRQKRFVDECLALSESNIPELRNILEDLNLDTRNAFDKFKDIIVNIFKKFKAKMEEKFNLHKKFLTDNKDIILTKKPEKEYTINNFYDYNLGIKNIEGDFPKLSTMDKLVSLSKEEVNKVVLPEYNGDGEFADFAKGFFMHNNTQPKDITSGSLNMQELYDFCIGFDKLNLFAKKVQTITSETVKVKTYVAKSLVSKNESFSEFGYNYIYSTVLETYINEDDATDTKQTITSDNEPKSSNQDAKGDAKLNTKVDDNDKPKDNEAKEDNANKKEEQKESNKKVKETGNWYLQALNTVLASKMTAYQTIYSRYIEILKYHVKAVNGTTEDAEEQKKDHSKLKDALKEYRDAEGDAKNAARDKVKAEFKAVTGKDLDNHGVDTLLKQNSKNLG